ncbi:hypothetical protein B0J13DRAFT_531515 [Dactylonectria estremocensis]|uniref:BRCT domain-containing protein n=1 Tax=Dactylonectria estremocensis TaxID=1079267 RepID=A0A9P9DRS4_9HYPO|nr:hypothetical protein B0J13DRAFT_531515 [Dactylonectria estremocensis]
MAHKFSFSGSFKAGKKDKIATFFRKHDVKTTEDFENEMTALVTTESEYSKNGKGGKAVVTAKAKGLPIIREDWVYEMMEVKKDWIKLSDKYYFRTGPDSGSENGSSATRDEDADKAVEAEKKEKEEKEEKEKKEKEEKEEKEKKEKEEKEEKEKREEEEKEEKEKKEKEEAERTKANENRPAQTDEDARTIKEHLARAQESLAAVELYKRALIESTEVVHIDLTDEVEMVTEGYELVKQSVEACAKAAESGDVERAGSEAAEAAKGQKDAAALYGALAARIRYDKSMSPEPERVATEGGEFGSILGEKDPAKELRPNGWNHITIPGDKRPEGVMAPGIIQCRTPKNHFYVHETFKTEKGHRRNRAHLLPARMYPIESTKWDMGSGPNLRTQNPDSWLDREGELEWLSFALLKCRSVSLVYGLAKDKNGNTQLWSGTGVRRVITDTDPNLYMDLMRLTVGQTDSVVKKKKTSADEKVRILAALENESQPSAN